MTRTKRETRRGVAWAVLAGLAVEGRIAIDASVGGNRRVGGSAVTISDAGHPAYADFMNSGGPRGGMLLARANLGNFEHSILRAFRGDSIEIISDGSDGGEARVRVHGTDDFYWLVEYELIKGAFVNGDPKPLTADLDALRSWVEDLAPDLVDRATAKAITTLRRPYPQSAELAMKYHEISRNDELLIPLLEHGKAGENRELARSIANRLSDETRRTEYLEKLK